MQDYIVCENKGNRPRIHVKICQHRCKMSGDCKAFQAHMKAQSPDETAIAHNAGVLSAEKSLVPASS